MAKVKAAASLVNPSFWRNIGQKGWGGTKAVGRLSRKAAVLGAAGAVGLGVNPFLGAMLAKGAGGAGRPWGGAGTAGGAGGRVGPGAGRDSSIVRGMVPLSPFKGPTYGKLSKSADFRTAINYNADIVRSTYLATIANNKGIVRIQQMLQGPTAARAKELRMESGKALAPIIIMPGGGDGGKDKGSLLPFAALAGLLAGAAAATAAAGGGGPSGPPEEFFEINRPKNWKWGKYGTGFTEWYDQLRKKAAAGKPGSKPDKGKVTLEVDKGGIRILEHPPFGQGKGPTPFNLDFSTRGGYDLPAKTPTLGDALKKWFPKITGGLGIEFMPEGFDEYKFRPSAKNLPKTGVSGHGDILPKLYTGADPFKMGYNEMGTGRQLSRFFMSDFAEGGIFKDPAKPTLGEFKKWLPKITGGLGVEGGDPFDESDKWMSRSAAAKALPKMGPSGHGGYLPFKLIFDPRMATGGGAHGGQLPFKVIFDDRMGRGVGAHGGNIPSLNTGVNPFRTSWAEMGTGIRPLPWGGAGQTTLPKHTWRDNALQRLRQSRITGINTMIPPGEGLAGTPRIRAPWDAGQMRLPPPPTITGGGAEAARISRIGTTSAPGEGLSGRPSLTFDKRLGFGVSGPGAAAADYGKVVRILTKAAGGEAPPGTSMTGGDAVSGGSDAAKDKWLKKFWAKIGRFFGGTQKGKIYQWLQRWYKGPNSQRGVIYIMLVWMVYEIAKEARTRTGWRDDFWGTLKGMGPWLKQFGDNLAIGIAIWMLLSTAIDFVIAALFVSGVGWPAGIAIFALKFGLTWLVHHWVMKAGEPLGIGRMPKEVIMNIQNALTSWTAANRKKYAAAQLGTPFAMSDFADKWGSLGPITPGGLGYGDQFNISRGGIQSVSPSTGGGTNIGTSILNTLISTAGAHADIPSSGDAFVQKALAAGFGKGGATSYQGNAASAKMVNGKAVGGYTTIKSKSGQTATVARAWKANFMYFINDLENTGYTITYLGGHRSGPKWHNVGGAIDINWKQNPMYTKNVGGTRTRFKFCPPFDEDAPYPGPSPLPGKVRWYKTRSNKVKQKGRWLYSDMPENISDIARRYGLSWGGDWGKTTRDTMHFSVGNNELYYKGVNALDKVNAPLTDQGRLELGLMTGSTGQSSAPTRAALRGSVIDLQGPDANRIRYDAFGRPVMGQSEYLGRSIHGWKFGSNITVPPSALNMPDGGGGGQTIINNIVSDGGDHTQSLALTVNADAYSSSLAGPLSDLSGTGDYKETLGLA